MNGKIRRNDRSLKDIEQILRIVNQAKVLHLGLVDEGFPYIVPLHYGYKYDEENDTFTFYMHGAKEGHKIELIKQNANVFVELETDVELDSGGDIPCKYGSFYASLMGQGHVSIVEDMEEKKNGLNLLMENQPGRTFEFSDAMADTVTVMKVVMKDYTAKAKQQ